MIGLELKEHITVPGDSSSWSDPQERSSSNNKQWIEGRRRERREGERKEQGSERDEGAILSHTVCLFLIWGASLSYLCQFYFIYILRPFGGLKYVFIYLFIVCISWNCAHTCTCQHTTAHIWRSEDNLQGSSMWILETELGSLLDLTADIFTCWAIHHS